MPILEQKNMTVLKENTYDVLFIGSGISSSYTIINLLKRLSTAKNQRLLHLAILDKHPEFHKGIAYGDRSTTSCLLITSLKDFLPEPELGRFVVWIKKNKKWLLDEFFAEGGILSEQWLEKHNQEIDDDQWEGLFLPRRWFGWYIDNEVSSLIERAIDNGLITVDYITSEVINIAKEKTAYRILGKTEEFLSKKVVLAVGTLPPKSIWPKKYNRINNGKVLFIPSPYEPFLKSSLERVKDFLSTCTEANPNVLIVGANAGALELLYKLNDDNDVLDRINKFYFLSTLGLLPDSKFDPTTLDQIKIHNLHALKSSGERITAEKIAKAAMADIEFANNLKIGAATSIKVISKGFVDMLGVLDDEQLEEFACHFGYEIGRRQRCAGEHYASVIDELKTIGRFEHLAGRFMEIDQGSDHRFYLKYKKKDADKPEIHDTSFSIIMNSMGSESLNGQNIPPLFSNLISTGICMPNKSNKGFKVNQQFEADQNFYIAGPLLAGNVINGNPMWHLEHCGRIIWSSEGLSEAIIENL